MKKLFMFLSVAVLAVFVGWCKDIVTEPSNVPAKAGAREATAARQITVSGTGASNESLGIERREGQ